MKFIKAILKLYEIDEKYEGLIIKIQSYFHDILLLIHNSFS